MSGRAGCMDYDAQGGHKSIRTDLKVSLKTRDNPYQSIYIYPCR